MQKDNTPPFVHWATKGRNLVSFLLGGKLLKKLDKKATKWRLSYQKRSWRTTLKIE
jgi:hypothetical protein